MPSTPNLGIVYPDSSGNTRLWEHFQNLATSVDTAVGDATSFPHIYANTTARDTAIPTPVAGNRAYTQDTNDDWVYDGSAWRSSTVRYTTSPAMVQISGRFIYWSYSIITTDGNGDADVIAAIAAATGLSVYGLVVWNGDGVARVNAVVGFQSVTLPGATGLTTGKVRAWSGASGTAITGSAFRYQYIAIVG
jgi:hypothetical protein